MIAARLRSFGHAMRGGMTLLKTQPNARIHLVATVGVVVAGAVWRISPGEWALVAVACGLVWMAEAFNTALEFLADEVSLERREGIKRAKDVAAFAVLVAAGAAVGIGAVVFGARIVAMF
ncbi:diacylglycerol kinase [Nibricoccus aquaticus]|uniref:Diacylglycerol kinase n=1 Tax=Nibricoccus aquaticus TaxID=2576891 RepID=A0A290Q7L2_9BACT|nr:diacylglycerol kinase family protein [Nibricoccus aquaticus]ATC64257.1 diacylglycerol kinase [Nibricoccus aquaticus]